MLPRQDFIFTIGYDGPAAVVDNQAKKRYGSLSTRQLAEKGLFRAAYSSAIFSKDPAELETVVAIYNKVTGAEASSSGPLTVSSPLNRLFGVFPVDVK
ncbi:MAG: hypothetical protein LBN21_04520 [Treponema sp.]|jgi:hypothetical protein|nr:hypothetical protein [Treponema sp.]